MNTLVAILSGNCCFATAIDIYWKYDQNRSTNRCFFRINLIYGGKFFYDLFFRHQNGLFWWRKKGGAFFLPPDHVPEPFWEYRA